MPLARAGVLPTTTSRRPIGTRPPALEKQRQTPQGHRPRWDVRLWLHRVERRNMEASALRCATGTEELMALVRHDAHVIEWPPVSWQRWRRLFELEGAQGVAPSGGVP